MYRACPSKHKTRPLQCEISILKSKRKAFTLRINRVRWLIFVLCLEILIATPFTILWGQLGAIAGVSITIGLLAYIRRFPLGRLEARLGAERLAKAEDPTLFSALEELSRQLRLPMPNVFRVDSDSVQFGAFGVSKSSASILVSRGATQTLSREQLVFALGYAMFEIQKGSVFARSWLALTIDAAHYYPSIKRTNQKNRPTAFNAPLLALAIFYLPAKILNPAARPPAHAKHALNEFRWIWEEILRKAESVNERQVYRPAAAFRGIFFLPLRPESPIDSLFRSPKTVDARPTLSEVVALS